MTNYDFHEYLILNTFKVVESTNLHHPIGKVFIRDLHEDYIGLVPADISVDNKVMKLAFSSYVEEDKIKANGITLQLVSTIK